MSKAEREEKITRHLAWIIVFCIFLLDQFTKSLAKKFLSPGESYSLIKGLFHISLVFNKGGAFGLFKGQSLFFILVSISAVILIFVNIKSRLRSSGFRIRIFALSIILAGALGNLIDRLRFGYVVDFLDLRIWPVFNIADSAITIGAILLGYSLLREIKGKQAKTI